MTEIAWHELFMPRGLTLDTVTGFVRPLASRPRVGFTGRVPIVVVEQWAVKGMVRHLIGIEAPLGAAFVDQLIASVPGMSGRKLNDTTAESVRRPLFYGMEIGMNSVAATLRTDVAVEISAAVGSALGTSTSTLAMQWLIGPSRDRTTRPQEFNLAESLGFVPKAPPSARDESSWRTKASEPLFAVRGRLGTTGRPSSLSGLRAAMQLADTAGGHMTFLPSKKTPERIAAVSPNRWGGVASSREVATLMSFPLGGTEHTRDLPIGDQPLPPAPNSPGRAFGVSLHPAARGRQVIQPVPAIPRGTLLSGPNGSGKSHLMARMALSDITARRPTIVIDPKGDLVENILGRMSDAAAKRTIVIDGGATERPAGFNPLAGPRATAERRSDEIVALFRDLHGTALGPRSSDVLLHAVLLAARLPDGMLVDVPHILTNTGFRRRVAGAVADPVVLRPWLAWFDNLGDAERAQITAPILNKLRSFVSRSSIRRILGQPTPGWSWDDVLRDRGIVLVTLNRGAVGPENARLAGALFLGQLWAAIQRRVTLGERKRPLGSLYIDEWPQFISGLDFADVMATIRGHNMGLVLANQHLTQVPPTLRAAVAANLRSKLTFTPSRDDANPFADLFGSDAVTADDLGRLGEFEAVASIYGQPGAFHLAAQPLNKPLADADKRRHLSQQRYGHDGTAIDEQLLQRWQGPPPDSAVGRIKRGPQG